MFYKGMDNVAVYGSLFCMLAMLSVPCFFKLA